MADRQLPRSNGLSRPPPADDLVAVLDAEEATVTLQGCRISPRPAQNHLPATRAKRGTLELERGPEQKSPPAVGPWLADSLDDRWQGYQEQLRRCRRRFSEEAVHELRVATRRLMALFTLLSCVPGRAVGESGRRALKAHLKALNELRDTHVQRLFLEQQMPRFPELFLVRDFLQRRERRLAKAVPAVLEGFKTRKREKWVASLCAEFNRQPGGGRRQAQLLAAVMRGATQAFAEVVARRREIDPADLGTIHRTRIAFKRFRYMVESLSPAFTGLGKRDLRPLAVYQRKMGTLQDLEVMRDCLDRFARAHQGAEVLLRPFCRQLQRRRTRSLRCFLRSADQLLGFWPPPPLAGERVVA